MSNIYQQLEQIGILPVVTIDNAETAANLAETLVNSGVGCIEITCRTASALDAIRAVKQADIDILLGAGTVTNPELLAEVVDIGVDFIVSPGVTDKLLWSAVGKNIPFLPGVSSASEVMLCVDYGLTHLKMFPAIPINALQLLNAFHATFPGVKFCPTGGINIDNMDDFIQIPNVFCVGGSWMVKPELIENRDWDTIARLSTCCMNKLASLEQT